MDSQLNTGFCLCSHVGWLGCRKGFLSVGFMDWISLVPKGKKECWWAHKTASLFPSIEFELFISRLYPHQPILTCTGVYFTMLAVLVFVSTDSNWMQPCETHHIILIQTFAEQVVFGSAWSSVHIFGCIPSLAFFFGQSCPFLIGVASSILHLSSMWDNACVSIFIELAWIHLWCSWGNWLQHPCAFCKAQSLGRLNAWEGLNINLKVCCC